MSLEHGTALVRKWAPRFGLGHYRLTVQPMPMDDPEAWGRSFYDVEEEWGVIELPPDDYFPPATLELLVLHELGHGLLKIAAASHQGEEAACNRIARMALSDWQAPLMNEHQASVMGEAWYEGEGAEKSSATALDKRKWLSVIADALPEKERVVIALMYWGDLSFRQTAQVLGVDVHTVARWRDAALQRMRTYYEAAEEHFGG